MADHSIHLETATQNADTSRPLLSTLSRWWSPALNTPESDAMLGYESAHPWALAADAVAERTEAS